MAYAISDDAKTWLGRFAQPGITYDRHCATLVADPGVLVGTVPWLVLTELENAGHISARGITKSGRAFLAQADA